MFRAYGLYTHIQANRLRSIALLAAFVLLLHASLFSLILLFEAGRGGDAAEIFAAAWTDMARAWPVAMIAAGIWFIIAFFFHQRMIDYASRSTGIERHDAPRLYAALENLCISRGVAMPKLKIIDTPAANAFASGLGQRNASISVTRGLLDTLSDAEIEAVLAHELTHIRNRDTQVMIVAVIFAGIIAFIGDLAFRRLDFPFGASPQRQRRSGRDGDGGAVLIILAALAVILISWGVSVLIRFALSRSREFLADAGSAELTKNPDAMISALRKIASKAVIPDMPSRMHAFFIESPAMHPARGWLATHPPLEQRIEALVRFAGGSDAGAINLDEGR
jgi:heat shock protein HtpX